jgi:hypothetical protein
MYRDYLTTETPFEPEAILPVQFFGGRQRTDEPLKKLMFALLIDAVRCYQTCFGARTGARAKLFADAHLWIFADDVEAPLSLDVVCDALEIGTDYLRHALSEWGKRRLTGQARMRLPRRSPVIAAGRIGETDSPRRASSRNQQARMAQLSKVAQITASAAQ